jgi:hypothetical protein
MPPIFSGHIDTRTQVEVAIALRVGHTCTSSRQGGKRGGLIARRMLPRRVDLDRFARERFAAEQ